ncbi:hypothetical protein POJ06DRAFT_274617 [Lipomyces tetrasporus]|uniref:FAR1 domain-containing protein n=1 Tax=Lipomyces tetrasporus TaxID=54092 RepID=A0AAD7VSW9_9ASCO|nr:uncharacterized protein POJ06DRAFT_274617 [Lipomyces tetrasporus]KAJ8100838.1 hypothetical protein POJ06DRAFT_274617 [Lipomyces tetrasporus]
MSPDGWSGSPSSDNDLSEQYFDVNDEFSDVDEDEEMEEWEGFDDDGPGTPATSMPPPPETVYPDVDTAKKSIQFWARMHGYAIRTQRSKARKNGDISKVFLQCDRGGQYKSRHRDESTRQRHLTGSCKTNCPFSVVVTESNGTWEVKVRDSGHNHDASIHDYAHPVHRRDDIRRGGVYDIVYTQVRAGIRARETVRTLRQLDPSTSVTRRDIHNLRADIKRKELAGLSPIQALLFQLDEDSDYISFNKRDENQRTRESFNQAWTELRNRYESKPQFMDYLSDELLPKKEKFVRYWTNNALHFGTIVTSRGEAVHSSLKSQLHHSVGDLKDVVDTFSLIFKDQQHEYSVEVERAKNTRQHRHSRQLFCCL